MKIIAFKRSNNSHLHPEFITEWVDAASLPSTEGYETMVEDHFNLELAKNEERHAQHLKYLKEQEVLAQKASQDAGIAVQAQEREDDREYKRFRAWQRNKGKTNGR